MKNRLYGKLVISFIAFVVGSFILVSTLTSHLAYQYVRQQTAEKLYRESNLIARNYAYEYYTSNITLEDLHSHFSTLSGYLSAEIWVISPQGHILVNSDDPTPNVDNPDVIEEFDISAFGNSYMTTGDFFGYFSKDYLSVFSPITTNYKVMGYVFIHMPLSQVYTTNNEILNIAYITWALICGFVLILFVIVATRLIHPIRRIAKAAGNYSDGNFSESVGIQRGDEIGYLSASLDYIANEMNTLEDDQKKFISNVSHDFRSPLTSIKGYVEAMLDGTITPDIQDKYLKIILFETERLTKLTKSILELNKYGSHGRTILDVSDFDINKTIKTTVQTFEGTCKEKHISFELILTDDELFVRADMSKIQQVLYNLIDNAVKFSSADSTITIETTLKNDKVFLSVKDRGIGIPKESISKIWERFYKTDLSRGKDKKGTGLGLAIVKEIVQAHNENINVISTEGVGTEFIFTLSIPKEN